ncbi:hypothetical protein SCLCIDRAFT_1220554, partial [Scleroderma citrinum Foug A]
MVINKGDHPIQVGLYYHFVETPAFDRVKAQCASDLISLQAQLEEQDRYRRQSLRGFAHVPEPDAPVVTDDFNLGKEEHIP